MKMTGFSLGLDQLTKSLWDIGFSPDVMGMHGHIFFGVDVANNEVFFRLQASDSSSDIRESGFHEGFLVEICNDGQVLARATGQKVAKKSEAEATMPWSEYQSAVAAGADELRFSRPRIEFPS